MRSISWALALSVIATSACNDVPEGAVVGIQPEAPVTTDELTAAILTEAVDKDEVTYSYAWSVDGAGVEDLTTATVPPDRTAKGQEWTVVVTPNDGRVDGVTAQASVTIGNSAPTAQVSLEPLDPTTLDELQATATTDDLDGDAVTLEWLWTRNGLTVSGADTDSIDASETEKGDVWEVMVTPTDGETVGVAVTASVSIGNEAPVADGVSLSPDEVRARTTVMASATGTDPDGDELTWTYTWYVSGGEVASGPGDSLAGAFAKGDEIFVEAVASDGSASSSVVQSGAVTVLNTPPSVESAAIDPAMPMGDAVLSCVPTGTTDVDGDPVTTSTRWTVDGREIGTFETIDNTYFRAGSLVTCTITPNDGEEDGTPVSSASVEIGNTPPTIASVSINPSAPGTSDDLSVSVVGVADRDGDKVRLSYAWSIGGKTVSTSDTLSSSAHSKGDVVSVTVTPNDGTDDGTPAKASATIVNSAPSAPVAAIDPGSPGLADDLVCELATASVDPDGDRVSYTVSWTRNGTTWSGKTGTTTITGDTIGSSSTADKDTWRCTITASDGSATASGVSTKVKVANSKDFTVFVTRTFVGSTSSTHLASRKAADAKCASEASALGVKGSNWKVVYSHPSEDAKDYLDYDASRGDRVFDVNGKQIDGGDLWGTKANGTLPDLKNYTITGTGPGGKYKACSGSYPAGTWPICQYCSKKFACAGSGEDAFDPPRCCWTGTRAIVCMGDK